MTIRQLSLRHLRAAAIATVSTLSLSLPGWTVSFGQREVDQSRFVAIASPVGSSGHQLLILEQVSDARSCWREVGSNPTRIDPLLLNFDFSGICGRSTDSNGYSIRAAGEDLGLSYSLRVVNREGNLVLVGSPFNRRGGDIEIGRASGAAQDYVKISLNPAWRFTKRTYGDRTLGHIYLTRDTPVPPPGTEPTPPPSEPETPPPPSGTIPFGDVAGDIYAQDIQQAVELGFIAGFAEDNTFRPLASLTREQIVSMVLEALTTLPDSNLSLPTQTSQAPYPDVASSRWSAAKIQFARENAIVSGYPDGTFRPTQAVTRAELMAILRRAAEYGRSLQNQVTDLDSSQEPFAFADTSGHWAAALIEQMSAYCGVASPYNEQGRNFFPDQATQRNYAAAATLRTLNCLQPD